MADKKAKSRCADCEQIGHWHGDEVCDKVKKAKRRLSAARKAQAKAKVAVTATTLKP